MTEPDEGLADVGVPALRSDTPRIPGTTGVKGKPQGTVRAARPSNPPLEQAPPGAARGTGRGRSEAEEGLQASQAPPKTPADSAEQAERVAPHVGEAPKASGTAVGGWGWLPSTTALQQAAAGALRDVRELTDSFQQACAPPDLLLLMCASYAELARTLLADQSTSETSGVHAHYYTLWLRRSKWRRRATARGQMQSLVRLRPRTPPPWTPTRTPRGRPCCTAWRGTTTPSWPASRRLPSAPLSYACASLSEKTVSWMASGPHCHVEHPC